MRVSISVGIDEALERQYNDIPSRGGRSKKIYRINDQITTLMIKMIREPMQSGYDWKSCSPPNQTAKVRIKPANENVQKAVSNWFLRKRQYDGGMGRNKLAFDSVSINGQQLELNEPPMNALELSWQKLSENLLS